MADDHAQGLGYGIVTAFTGGISEDYRSAPTVNGKPQRGDRRSGADREQHWWS